MISIIVSIVILGLVAYGVTLLPIPQPFKQIINVILIIAAILYLLNFAGVNVPLFR